MSADVLPLSSEDDAALDPLDELATIVAELRQYVLFQELCGADGLPRDRDLKERLKQNPLPSLDKAGYPVDSSQPVFERDESGLSAVPPAAPTSLPVAPTPRPPGVSAARRYSPGQQTEATPSLVRTEGPSALIQLGNTLDEVRGRVASCTACGLHAGRTQTVFSRGTGSSGLCFVGEGPGADEDAQGEPFVGMAGQLLDKMIQAMGFSRDEVYVCNVVKCRPPDNRKPAPVEMQSCVGYLHRQLELIEPQVIVALGATAVEGLLGVTQGITRIRGSFRLYQGRIAVMPTFHPAYLLRNAAAKRDVWSDLQQVVRHMGREIP